MIRTLHQEIKIVLKNSKKPMTTKQIVEEIRRRGYYQFRGKTPNASVCARIITEIKDKGEDSIFEKVERGFKIKHLTKND